MCIREGLKMVIFIVSAIFVLVLYTVFFGVRAMLCMKKIKKEKLDRSVPPHFDKNIVIAIPALREQNCIEDTVKYFCEITQDIPIVIITTQKEVLENRKHAVLTQDIVKNKILPNYPNVYLVDYPDTEGYMADQLNYMLDHLDAVLSQKIDLEKTYLALYNADSRPHPHTFDEVKRKIAEGHKVIQQYSYCMKNYNKLSPILRGFAIYQSNFELKTGWMNGILKSKFLYTHVVGHGLFIELETLKNLGNFNTEFWCEDMYLGLQLKANRIEIKPLLALENVETPNSFTNLVRQNAVWFKTTSSFFKMYKDILKKHTVMNRLNGWLGCFNECRCAINWIGFPFILWFLFIAPFAIKAYWLFAVVMMSYLFYISMNAIVTMKFIQVANGEKYKVQLKTVLYLAMATSISNFGPLYSVIMNKKRKHKTER